MSLDDDILIDNYLRGQLSDQEIVAFELKLKSDDEFRKNVELERALWVSQNESDWSFANPNNEEVKAYKKLLEEPGIQSLKKSLGQINTTLKKDSKSTVKNWVYYMVAASIAIFFCLNIFFNQNSSNQELVDDFLSASDLPSFTSRGASETEDLILAQEFFEKENFKDALDIFIPILDSGIKDASVYLYTGISQMKLKQYGKAETTFDALIASDLLDAQKGYWYKALLYLQQDHIDDCKTILSHIVSQSLYNHTEAKALLKVLNDD